MFCAISGHVAQDPLFAPKSGLVYEGRVIKKAIEADGKCPVSGLTLDAEQDLVPMKTSPVVAPRPPSGSSFPSLLTTLQNEWDSLMLEQVNLRKELVETRRDLATALYEREAASAVIARLLKENEQLKNDLEKVGGAATSVVTVKSPANGNTDGDFASAMKVLMNQLEPVRMQFSKRKEAPEDLCDLAKLNETPTQNLMPHKSNKPGVSCVALESFNLNQDMASPELLLSGGVDGEAHVVEVATGQKAKTLKHHKSRVNDISWRGGVVTTCSQDKTVAVWTAPSSGELGELKKSHVINEHSKAVVSCPIHPTGKVGSSASADGSWTLFDLETGTNICKRTMDDAEVLNIARFHPDGHLLGVGGESGMVRLFGMETPSEGNPLGVLNHGTSVAGLAFNENGYVVATSGVDGIVKIWDLRKLAVAAEIAPDKKSGGASCIEFDRSGFYLGIGHAKGGVHVVRKPETKTKKTWDTVIELYEHKKSVTGLAFHPNAEALWTSSMDRTLKQFSFTQKNE